MNSIWVENVNKPKFDSLCGSHSTEVLIIGGGIAGILCAYKLKAAGVDCMLVEAKEICSGITKNTTAKITLHHNLIYDKLIKTFGRDMAELYLDSQLRAEEEYRDICSQIDCDYQVRDSFVYSLNNHSELEKEVNALVSLGLDAKLVKTDELPFETVGAVCIKRRAQFHPLKFLYSIAEGLPIYENTKIREIMPGRAVFCGGEIKYKKAIVATHFPIINKHGFYFLKMYQERSYVLALSGANPVHGMYIDEADGRLSFRSYGDLLLLGGGGHRTGKNGGSYPYLEAVAEKYYPKAKIVQRWATQDCMTLDGIPYVGRYSKNTPDLFVATGFNKWGMTSAMASASILADLVQDKKNVYADLYSPSRSILRPQLAINAFETTIGLLTPTVKRCPHLGCALKYNREEHTWDCPCHGSRFAEDGQLIDNPATAGKRIE